MKLIIFILFIYTNLVFSSKTTDSLLVRLNTGSDSDKYSTLIKLSDNYKEVDSIFFSIKYAKMAMATAKEKNKFIDYATASFKIGKNYYHYGDNNTAIEYYLISKDIFEKYSKFEMYSRVLNALAISYGDKNLYYKSLECLNEMIYLNKNILYSDKRLSKAYSNIGFVYYHLEKYEKAETFYLKAISLNKDINNINILINNYINLGMLYVNTKDNKLAISYLNKALEKIKENSNSSYSQIGIIYENLSFVARDLRNVKEQKDNLFLSLEYHIKSKNNKNISNAYSYIADYYSITNYNKAISYIDKSIKIALKTNNKNIVYTKYLVLSKIYESNNELDKALFFYKKYSVIQDSILLNMQLGRVGEIENVNLLKEKDYRFSLLDKENEINKVKVEKANQEIRIYTVIIIISVLLIIIVVVSLIIISKQLKLKRLHLKSIAAINNKISIQNLEIIKQKEVLVKTNSDLEIANEYAESLRAEAVQNSEYKSQFLANMSHEIRIDIQSNILITDIMQVRYLDYPAKESAWIINNSANNLLTVINDILDYSKIESNQIILEHIPLKLNEEIDEVVQMLKQKSDDKGLELLIEYDKDIPEYIISDPIRIKQIITNLVNNALKFTREGYVKIIVELFESTNSDVTIKFRVIDTGIGIKDEFLDAIFNDFTQADKSTTRKYGGTGLGLSIAKHLAELLKGSIGIYSKDGEGSEFWFTIKATIFKDIGAKKEVAKELNFNVKHKYNILIVEDDSVNIELLTTTLNKANHTFVLAKNGLEALNIYKEKHNEIQIILMDLHMPIMDGYKAVSEIRKYEKGNSLKQTYIIAVTANAMYGEKEKCIAAGMNDYISKPFKPKELLDFIENTNIFDVN